jgi:hypothetical protein
LASPKKADVLHQVAEDRFLGPPSLDERRRQCSIEIWALPARAWSSFRRLFYHTTVLGRSRLASSYGPLPQD